ncbi:MAG: sel1 repeat family protein [Rhodospirillales bacterium]|nr:sel1 repeat family protein [Rhodospirillales bacterium]
MYFKGEGVPKDHREAARWYRMAAEQGYANAQVNLGASYFAGSGLPKDYVQAYMWFNLASSQGFEGASERREIVAQFMTPAQIAQAQALSRNWKPKE